MLQNLLTELEAPGASYPVTSALLQLLSDMLRQQYVGGPMASLVMYAVNYVLGTMPQLQFSSPTDKWRLSAACMEVIRLGVDANAAMEGGVLPKSAGAPVGVKVTALATCIIHHMAYAGECG